MPPRTTTTNRTRKPAVKPEVTPETPEAETPETPEADNLPAVPETPAETPAETQTDYAALLAEKDDARYVASDSFDVNAQSTNAVTLSQALAASAVGSTLIVLELALIIARMRSLIFPTGQTSPDWGGKSWAAREYTRRVVTVPALATFKANGLTDAEAEAETEALAARVAKRVQRVALPQVVREYALGLATIPGDVGEDGLATFRAPETDAEVKDAVAAQYHGAMSSSGKALLAPGETRTRENKADTGGPPSPNKLPEVTQAVTASIAALPQATTATFVLGTMGTWFTALREDSSFRGDGTDREQTIALLERIGELALAEAERIGGTLDPDAVKPHYDAVNDAAALLAK